MRLTRAIKQKIVENALVASGVLDLKEKLQIEEGNLAEACRVYSLGGAEKSQYIENKHKELAAWVKCDNLEEVISAYSVQEVFNKRHFVKVLAKGNHYTLNFFGHKNTKNKCVVRKYSTTELTDTLSKKVLKLKAQQDACAEKTQNIRETVWASLEGVTTTAKLIQAWPEAEKLIPAEEKKPGKGLSVPVNTLNSLIGLNKKI